MRQRARLGGLVITVLLAVTGCGTTTTPTALGTSGVPPSTTGTAAPAPTAAPAHPLPGPTSRASTRAPATGSTGALLGVDNFDGSTLDRSRWQVYDALATNGTSRWSTDMVRVTGGELQIVGSGRDPTGQSNVSGGLCWCNGSGVQTYGRWQVRARFDAGAGYGQAILLWPQSERWPDDGELDLVETPTATKRTAEGTVHWGVNGVDRADTADTTGDFTQWHVYTLDWRPTYVKMYIDDVLFYDSTRAGRATIPNTPMSLALQQEPGPFGDNWVPAPTPATPAQVVMHIDWVKLYR